MLFYERKKKKKKNYAQYHFRDIPELNHRNMTITLAHKS